MPTEPDLKQFQRTHTNHLGRPLAVDGVLGPQTQWALAMAALDPRRRIIVERAISQLGRTETPPGSNRSASIDAWLRACGVAPGNAWCAAFASWCLGDRAIAGAVLLGQSFPETTSPSPGDLFWYRTNDRGNGHIGVITGVDRAAGVAMTVEGNVDSQVGCWRRDLSKVHCSRTVDGGGTAPVIASVPMRAVNGVGTR